MRTRALAGFPVSQDESWSCIGGGDVPTPLYRELLTTRFSGKGRRQKSIEACPWQQQRYVAPHYEATLPLPRHLITLFSSSGRTCGVRVAHKERKARDVIGDVLKADFGLGPHLADGADIAAVHGRLDMAENVLDTYAHPRTLGVGGFLLRGQRFVAIGAFVNMGGAAFPVQPCFLLFGTVGAVSPGLLAIVIGIKNAVQFLTVMDAGIRHFVVPDQLVRAVHVNVVFVAIIGRAVLLGPSRVRVLMRFLLLAPIGGNFTLFDRIVVVTTVALARHLDKGGVNDLTAAGLKPARIKHRVKLRKQLLDRL